MGCDSPSPRVPQGGDAPCPAGPKSSSWHPEHPPVSEQLWVQTHTLVPAPPSPHAAVLTFCPRAPRFPVPSSLQSGDSKLPPVPPTPSQPFPTSKSLRLHSSFPKASARLSPNSSKQTNPSQRSELSSCSHKGTVRKPERAAPHYLPMSFFSSASPQSQINAPCSAHQQQTQSCF